MKKNLNALVSFIFIASFSCMSSIQYNYSDGNGNQYHITPTSIQYNPITPEKSSSGFYSGGTPDKVKITTEEFNTLQDKINDAFRNTDIQIQQRMMMSAVLRKSNGSETETIILAPGCSEIDSIEKTLKSFLHSK